MYYSNNDMIASLNKLSLAIKELFQFIKPNLTSLLNISKLGNLTKDDNILIEHCTKELFFYFERFILDSKSIFKEIKYKYDNQLEQKDSLKRLRVCSPLFKTNSDSNYNTEALSNDVIRFINEMNNLQKNIVGGSKNIKQQKNKFEITKTKLYEKAQKFKGDFDYEAIIKQLQRENEELNDKIKNDSELYGSFIQMMTKSSDEIEEYLKERRKEKNGLSKPKEGFLHVCKEDDFSLNLPYKKKFMILSKEFNSLNMDFEKEFANLTKTKTRNISNSFSRCQTERFYTPLSYC